MRRIVVPALLAALILGTVGTEPACPDIVILKDGTVLECKIKEEKYPDPRARYKFVLVVEVDEKGTIKQIQSQDIKKEGGGYAVFRGKTTWEKRKEYLKDYEKRAQALKGTWESHQQLGKWCKSHLLPDKGEEQYKVAHKKKAEQIEKGLQGGKLRDAIGEHLKLAKWCEKDLGLFEEAKREFLTAYELKKRDSPADDAGAHNSLARWCEQTGLVDLAVGEYEMALGIDPKNSSAKGALDRIRNSMEFRSKQLAIDFDKNGRAWHFSVAIEDPVDKKFLEKWAKKIQDLSEYVFVVTEGQFFIADCEIEDNTSDAKIVVEKGKLDWRGLNNKEGSGVLAYCQASGTPEWQVHAPGESAVSVLAHEIFHGVFGLPDEYYQDPQCDCVMRSAPNPQKLCDDSNHIGGGRNSDGKDCWQIIRNRREFRNTISHPNTQWRWANPGGQQTSGGAKGDYVDGTRSAGGELTWQGMKLKAPPKTVIRIVDN